MFDTIIIIEAFVISIIFTFIVLCILSVINYFFNKNKTTHYIVKKSDANELILSLKDKGARVLNVRVLDNDVNGYLDLKFSKAKR